MLVVAVAAGRSHREPVAALLTAAGWGQRGGGAVSPYAPGSAASDALEVLDVARAWYEVDWLLPVWRRLRAPLERGVRTTRLTALDRATRHALSGVLGRPLVGDVPLVLADVPALLESRAGSTLEQVVVEATGPLRDRGVALRSGASRTA